ncbi:MAG: hypothetical protein JHC93_07970 [Parachlamydiales bacterium]|nr:hypothetical protein [Parachlamydiales bacterium]
MAISNDPVVLLPKDVIHNHIAPYLYFNEPRNVLKVCKQWRETFTEGFKACPWHRTRMNIKNSKFKIKFIDNDINFKGLQKLDNQILGLVNDDLCKFDIQTRQLETLHKGVSVFTTSDNTLIYLTNDAKLYVKDKNKEPKLLHENVDRLDTGNALILHPFSKNLYKIKYINEHCVITSFGCDYVHVIDKCGVKVSKFISKFTVLSNWNDQIVLGTFDNKIHLYDLDLTFRGCFCDYKANYWFPEFTSFIEYNGYLISAGRNLPIMAWKEDGTYNHLTKIINVNHLGIFDGRLTSAGDDLRIFDDNDSFTVIPLSNPSVEMAVLGGKIILSNTYSSQFIEYDFS